MANGEIIEKIESTDEQIHNLRKMVLESGSQIKGEGAKSAARAWLAEAKKTRKKVAKNCSFCL